MKKLLLISYYFPPIQSAESMMTLNYVKYLPQFGWTATVLCGKPSAREPIDYSSRDKIPSNIQICRINSLENIFVSFLKGLKILPGESGGVKISRGANAYGSSLAGRIASFIRSMKFLPSRIGGWMPFVVGLGIRTLKKEDVEIIISRSTPVTSHLAALILKSLSGLPWIPCFSDPWTTDPNLPYRNKILPEKLIKRHDEYLEQKVISRADKVIFTTERLKEEYVQRYKYIPKDKFIVIPNSYDPEQFYEVTNIDDQNKSFTIAYAGTFADARSPEPLFKALKLLREEGDIYTRMNVKLIGRLGNFGHLIQEYGLNTVVQVMGRVSHKDASCCLRSSDVLLLIDSPIQTMCLPSKLIEYIFIGKPILAITPEEGSSADVIRATKTGIVISPHDIEGIKNAIKHLYTNYVNGNLGIKPDWNEINRYSAERCTKILIETIELLIDQHEKESRHENN